MVMLSVRALAVCRAAMSIIQGILGVGISGDAAQKFMFDQGLVADVQVALAEIGPLAYALVAQCLPEALSLLRVFAGKLV
jgi:hypothetical protein